MLLGGWALKLFCYLFFIYSISSCCRYAEYSWEPAACPVFSPFIQHCSATLYRVSSDRVVSPPPPHETISLLGWHDDHYCCYIQPFNFLLLLFPSYPSLSSILRPLAALSPPNPSPRPTPIQLSILARVNLNPDQLDTRKKAALQTGKYSGILLCDVPIHLFESMYYCSFNYYCVDSLSRANKI